MYVCPPFITGYVILCEINTLHANVIHYNVVPVIPAFLRFCCCKIRFSDYFLFSEGFKAHDWNLANI